MTIEKCSRCNGSGKESNLISDMMAAFSGIDPRRLNPDPDAKTCPACSGIGFVTKP